MDLASKRSALVLSGASSARCLSGLHFRLWRIGMSMTAVTVVCDEKSVADKAATGALSCRAKRSRTMTAVPQAPFGSRSGQAFSRSVRRAHRRLDILNVERQPALDFQC